jgi:hypothetical protein
MGKSKMKADRIASIIGVIAGVNFLIFWIVAGLIGGDALNGYSENGQFFLFNQGRVTEVSYATFLYSKVHALSVIFLVTLALASGWFARSRHKNPN